ncbi:LysR family transcriptional regulator [Streptomyces sp. NPDC051976]|uniref:LysR family transcriptional regulator n=1 Tax=Streptomyces sp. NPDC051976 TaxID=3154947 RepID=UPI00342F9B87
MRYFVAVVDHGSTTRAAEALFVAQPSLSRQVRRLEGELGLRLFDHTAGRLRLTPAGRQFLPVARDLTARCDAAREAAAALAGGEVGKIALAAPVTTIADVIAPFIAQMRADAPMLTVEEVPPADAYAALWRGADLAISSVPPPEHLAGGEIARLPLLAYPPPGHAWEAYDGLRIEELVTQPLLLLTPEHGTRRLFDHAVQRAGVHCTAAFETSIPQIAQALAAAGHGVAVVSDDPRYELRSLPIVTDDGPLRISLYAGWETSHYAAQAIEPLVHELRAYFVKRYGTSAAPTPDTRGRERL